MKRNTLFMLLCMVLLCLCSVNAKANYAAGGELIYEWISGPTYRFYFKLYRNCAGNTEPTTLPLCFSSSCNSAVFTITMAKFPMTVPPYKFQCPQLQTQCDDPSATKPGYQEIWYYADATLPFACSSWKIFTHLSTRKQFANIASSSSTNLYIEASLNSQAFPGNTSPYYSNKPFLNPCVGNWFNFNNGAVDPNGDSLVHEVIQPMTTASCGSSVSPAGFIVTSPSLGVPANPLQTGYSFVLNAQTGLMSFTPTQAGISSLAIRTKEYRNGVLVGSVMREMPVNVYSCTPTPIFVSNPQGVVITCSGQNVSSAFYAKSVPGARLYVTNSTIPGATVSYTSQGTDSVAGSFSWTPPASASGFYSLSLTVTDSTCSAGTAYSYIVGIGVQVWNKINAGPDTALCAGSTIKLQVPGGGPLTWSVVSGDTNSLSCTGCTSPAVWPTVSTKYQVVVNGLPPGCPAVMDTVTVDMLPYNKPTVSIAVSPGASAWPGLNLAFTATHTYCDSPQYQWRVNGNNVPGATGAVFNTTTLAHNDIVTCLLHCSDTCIVDTPSNAIAVDIATGVENLYTNSARLYPNPNNGSFTLSGLEWPAVERIDIVNLPGQVVWTQSNPEKVSGKEMVIDVHALPPGQYILRVTDDSGKRMLRFTIEQ